MTTDKHDDTDKLLCNVFADWLGTDKRQDIILPDGCGFEVALGLLDAEINATDFPLAAEFWERAHEYDDPAHDEEAKYDLIDPVSEAVSEALEAAGYVYESINGASAKAIWAVVAGPYIKVMRQLEEDIAAGIIPPPTIDPSAEFVGPSSKPSPKQ